MQSVDSKYAKLLQAGLPGHLCLTWCDERDLDEVARRFGADVETGLWADEEDIEELEEDIGGELVQLSVFGDWTLAFESEGYQGSRDVVLRSLSQGGRALNIFWNVELDSSIAYAVDGVIDTMFDIDGVEQRSGARPAALDDALAEVNLLQDLTAPERKARALALGEKITGQSLTPEWLRSPRYVFRITDPLPNSIVPFAYLHPRAFFLDEPGFRRILANPSPEIAPAVVKELVSNVIRIAAIKGPIPVKVLQILDHGERFEGERELVRSELGREAEDVRRRMLRDAPDTTEKNQLDLTSCALVVLQKALYPDPAEAANAASHAALQLSVPTREDFMRLVVLSRLSERIDYDLRRSSQPGHQRFPER